MPEGRGFSAEHGEHGRRIPSRAAAGEPGGGTESEDAGSNPPRRAKPGVRRERGNGSAARRAKPEDKERERECQHAYDAKPDVKERNRETSAARRPSQRERKERGNISAARHAKPKIKEREGMEGAYQTRPEVRDRRKKQGRSYQANPENGRKPRSKRDIVEAAEGMASRTGIQSDACRLSWPLPDLPFTVQSESLHSSAGR